MRLDLRWLASVLCPLLLACGNGATTTGTTGAAGGSAGTGGTGGNVAGGIPDPGTTDLVDQNFASVEPNDTPETATPLGPAAMGDLNVWVDNNTFGGTANTADYFVFRSGPTAGHFTFDICFTAPLTGMTATLSKVVGNTAQTPPVGTWKSASTCVTNMGTTTALEAGTDYLFGLTATGGVGTYSA